jgi:hypothetical protein
MKSTDYDCRWYGGAYGSFNYESEFFTRWGARWDYSAVICDSEGPRDSATIVMGRLNIDGFRSPKTKRYRPTEWSVSLELGRHYKQGVAAGKCHSLLQAMRAADAALTQGVVSQFLSEVYCLSPLTESVYRYVHKTPSLFEHLRAGSPAELKRIQLLNPRNWSPWMSDLGIRGESSWALGGTSSAPNTGTFLTVRSQEGKLRGSITIRENWSTTWQSDEGVQELARRLGSWTHGSESNSDLDKETGASSRTCTDTLSAHPARSLLHCLAPGG